MNSSDYRSIAREKLAGNWGISILVALIASLLGGLLFSGSSFDLNLDSELLYNLPTFLQKILLTVASIAGTLSLVQFIIGGVIRLGYCQFLLKQQDGQELQVNQLFSQFHRFGDGFCLAFLEGLYTLLWSLLFIIPGIVASYRYAMAPFIMTENPGMTASEAIRASKAMMNGHKAELFLLDLSFIGWALLSALTLGIGTLFLNPYTSAARAAFYRNISRQTPASEI